MKKLICLLLALVLLAGLCACAKTPAKPDGPVRVMTLSGTTGFGMAKLIADNAAAEKKTYEISVETDASAVTAALVSGSCDIAALPTNAASVLWNKTQGGVQCLALNTRGVLYLLADGETSASSLAEATKETVYAPAQNPSFIFSALPGAPRAEGGADRQHRHRHPGAHRPGGAGFRHVGKGAPVRGVRPHRGAPPGRQGLRRV